MMDPQVLAGLLQGLGTILAAVVGLGLYRWQSANERRRDEAARLVRQHEQDELRRLRVRDMMVAIRAEIDIELEPLQPKFAADVLEAERTKAIARLRDDRVLKDKKDMPQAPAIATNFVFQDLRNDLELLPHPVIAAVVRYYKYDQRLSALYNAFTTGAYQDVNDERQVEAVTALFELGRRTLMAGENARTQIDAYLVREHTIDLNGTDGGMLPASVPVKHAE